MVDLIEVLLHGSEEVIPAISIVQERIMQTPDRRIISLIPSATEIVAFLGLTELLVGRSHECDYPPVVQSLPVCTAPKFNPEGTSREIHDRVTDLLQSALSVYQVKTDVLETLQPTHILTQAQCDVCAVSLTDVEQAVSTLTHASVQILSLQPNTLMAVWQDVERVASLFGVSAFDSLTAVNQRVEACTTFTDRLAESDRPTVACIEWINPLMAAGNWIPELVQLAGGINQFGMIGQHSPWLQWDDLVAANPEVIVIMPCGFDLDRSHQEALQLLQHPQWLSLQAVQSERVYVTDGNQYFNRPGPRLVNSLEILAEILHPNRFQFGYSGTAYRQFAANPFVLI
ncbi:cobalamin-binding protein [Thermocoleostomius sinensis A174]|uniref:Cobalamin-binding protein n=2 Tax=Thermocoleostomius TaxID=3065395 RepID=A0A9E8Z938_9CYAN|nr:cobalamin-binding protein [Thermocoleostomius sinensis A174]